jgi:CubicO group peptidase (beta-lactamase class C family)
MKRLIVIFFILNTFNMTAQMADALTHNAIKDSIVTFFNKQEFKQIYAMLSPPFKAQMTENELITFLKKDVYEESGKILKSEFLEIVKDEYLYKLTHQKEVLTFSLSVNKSKLIDGFSFVPFAEKAPKNIVKAASNNPMTTDLDKIVDSVARTYIDKENASGMSIGVIQDGKTYFYHYGEMDKSTKKMADNSTFYEIGSITKTFTGILLAHAVLEKKIDLETDIRRYLTEEYPNLEYKNQPILIKHLANHTSGIISFPSLDIMTQKGYDAKNPYKHYTSDMVLAYLHKVKLDTVPGFKSNYSNFATGLMGIILEKTYKMSYADLVKKYITDPLSMKATKIVLSDEEDKIFAKPYTENGNLTSHWDLTGLGAAGAIRSNIVDMLQYAKANMAASDEAMAFSQKPTFKQGAMSETGLYWQLNVNKKGQLVTWHNGGTGGFSTFCGFIREKNKAVVMLANSSDNVTQAAMNLLKAINQ